MPELITHLIYPEKYWLHGDFKVLYCAVGFFLAGLVIWRRPWLDDRFCMYLVRKGGKDNASASACRLIVNGKGIGTQTLLLFLYTAPVFNHFYPFAVVVVVVAAAVKIAWNAQNAARIITTRRRVKRAVLPLTAVTFLLLLCYYLRHLLSVDITLEGVNRLEYYLKLLLLLPLLLWCIMLSLFLLFYHFFAVTKYILLKQSYLRRRIDRLLRKLGSGKKLPKKASFALCQQEFLRLNRHLAYQCSEIKGYNQFWSHILTVIFAGEVHFKLIF